MISMIAAIGKNGALGLNGSLPWHLPADLKHFREVTTGKVIVMGRKTFESLPHILPDRFHVVLTRDRNFRCGHPRVSVQYDKKLVLEFAKFTELFVIGGAEIFREFLPDAERLYLTVLERDFQADVFFPAFDENGWTKIQERQGRMDEENTVAHRFVTLERNRSGIK